MPMLLIEGEYQAVGAQPDGDSLRFYPNDPSHWKLLPGPHPVHPNAAGGAQTRLDGIDALETHYPTSRGVVHQPLPLGRQAAAELLTWVGFADVVRGADETVTASTPMRAPGYVVTRTADLYGRCVAFLFKGLPPAPSGNFVWLDVARLRQSANHHLLTRGLAYPTYYTKLFPDLRQEMTAAVQGARPALGVWPEDDTSSGFVVQSLVTLFDQAVILPKLFRRLMDYLTLNDGDVSLVGFKAYLAARDDRLFILSTGHSTGFDFVVDVVGQTLRLTYAPEDLVFVER